MKKNKIIFFGTLLVLTFVLMALFDKNNIVYALDYVACGDATGIPKPVPQMTTIAYTLLMVGTPIVLIASSCIILAKAVMSGNEDNIAKSKEKLCKKFIIAGLVFLTSGLVQFVVARVSSTDSDKDTMGECLSCFLYFDQCEESSTGNLD